MKCGWSKLDKVETDCKKVKLGKQQPDYFKFKSICIKQVVNNA